MRSVGGNERDLTGGKGERGTIDGEVDRSAQDDGDLLFGMTMHRKDGPRLVDVAHQGLLIAMDGLPGDTVERMFDRNRVPVDGGGFGRR